MILPRELNLKHCSFTILDHNYVEEFLSFVKHLKITTSIGHTTRK